MFFESPADPIYPAPKVGGTVTFSVAASDPEGEAVTLSTTPLPSDPLVRCGTAVPTPPKTGTALVCTATTTNHMPGGPQQIIVSASDPEGQTVSTVVTMAGTANPAITTGRPGAVMPAVESISSHDHLILDLTQDGKDPFCGQGTACAPGWYPWAGHYFKNGVTLKVKLHHETQKITCDSSQIAASRVTPIRPAPGSDVVGYRVAFDATCGKGKSTDYRGIVVDVLIPDGRPSYSYSATGFAGGAGTDQVVNNLLYLAQVNGVTCFVGGQLEVINELLQRGGLR